MGNAGKCGGSSLRGGERRSFAARPCACAQAARGQWWYSRFWVIMTTVAQLLDQKGHNVESIAPDAMVYDAIKKMADLDIGALVVLEEGRVIGLLTDDIATTPYMMPIFLWSTVVNHDFQPWVEVGRANTPKGLCASG